MDALLDAAPEGLQQEIARAIARMDGVLDVDRVRVRRAGNRHFVDATVSVPRTATDPVAAGYVRSFAHPDGNMTGFVRFEASINSKWLQLLKDVAPNVTRVAVLRFGGVARARSDLQTIEAAATEDSITAAFWRRAYSPPRTWLPIA